MKQRLTGLKQLLPQAHKTFKVAEKEINGWQKFFFLNGDYRRVRKEFYSLKNEEGKLKDQYNKDFKSLKKQIRLHLEFSDKYFQQLLQDGLACFAGKVEFRVYESEINSNDHPRMASIMDGQLYKNETIICETIKSRRTSAYPEELKGLIDPYGKIRLTTVPSKTSWIKLSSVTYHPLNFTGTIDKQGNIELKAVKVERDWLTDRHMKKLSGRIFSSKQQQTTYTEVIQKMKACEKQFLDDL
jgi:hypothetical protein